MIKNICKTRRLSVCLFSLFYSKMTQIFTETLFPADVIYETILSVQIFY